jgi:adenylate cyclase
VDVQSVARELGVRYVLEGSVRKSANRVRISAQLIDGEAGNHIWADRYDRELEDIFAVQDEITNTVVTAIEPELSRAEQIRARRKRPDDLDAWDCYQRALWHVWRPGPDDNEEAKQLFSRATMIDPNFAAAHAGIAIAHLRSVTLAQALDRESAIQDGIEAARNALAIDDQDAVAYAALSCLDMLRGDLETAIEAAGRAIDINPSYAFARLSRGVQYARSGRVEEAFAELDEAERLSPRDPAQWIL